MGVGSGVAAQCGFKAESTVGTAVTVDHFVKHTEASGAGLKLLMLEDEGLGGSYSAPTIDRTVTTGVDVDRQVSMNVRTKGFGPLWKQMVGSAGTIAQIGATALWRQIHLDGDFSGKSLTVQLSYPESTPTGTNRAFTYKGTKVTEWTLTQARNELLKLMLSFDAWGEDTATALATASYPSPLTPNFDEALRFNCFSAQIGGTASVASGLTSVAGGAELKGCRGVTLKGNNTLRTDAYYSGGAGTKSEQLRNGFLDYTGDLQVDFQDRTQVYDIFAAYTTTVLAFTWTGKVDVGASNFGKLSVIYPQVKLRNASPVVSGPAAVDEPISFKAYTDPAGVLPMIQIAYESTDTAL